MLKKTSKPVAGNDELFNDTIVLINGDNSRTTSTTQLGLTDKVQKRQPEVKGSVSAHTFHPYHEDGFWAVDGFDGTANGKLQINDSDLWALGTNDFTMEAWVYTYGFDTTYNTIMATWTSPYGFLWYFTADTIHFYANNAGGGNYSFTDAENPISRWVHYAIVRNGNNFNAYQNGNQIGGTWNYSGSINNVGGYLQIGLLNDNNAVTGHIGMLSNVRIMNRAVYTDEFDPPSKPFNPKEDGTLLLCCADPTAGDISGHNHESHYSTVGTSIRVKQVNPWNNDYPWIAPDGYNSIYFPTNSSKAEFTINNLPSGSSARSIELWVFITDTAYAGTAYMVAYGTNSTNQVFSVCTDSNRKLRFVGYGGTSYDFTAPYKLPIQEWVHICYDYDGTDIRFFVDGLLVYERTQAINTGAHSKLVLNGQASGTTGTYNMAGLYIADLRVSDISRHTTNFVPPVKPHTYDSNTKILGARSKRFETSDPTDTTVTGTNAQISNRTPYNSINKRITNPNGFSLTMNVGAATNTACCLLGSGATDFNLSDGNSWCVEFWIFARSYLAYGRVAEQVTSASYWAIKFDDGVGGLGKMCLGRTDESGDGLISTQQEIGLNTWHHIAFTHESSTSKLRCFLDGKVMQTVDNFSLTGSGASWANATTGTPALQFLNYRSLNGYNPQIRISNFRMVQGEYVYNSEFTPSTSPLTLTSQGVTSSNVRVLAHQRGAIGDISSNNYKYGVYQSETHNFSMDAGISPFDVSYTEGVKEVVVPVKVESIDSANKYTFSNISVAGRELQLFEGIKYKFDLSDSSLSGHPFALSETKDGTHGNVEGFYSVQFDGTNDELEIPFGNTTSVKPLLIKADFTIEAWVYLDSAPHDYQMIISADGGNTYVTLRQSRIDVRFDNLMSFNYSTTPSANTWYHVAVTRTGSTVRTFLAGNLLGSATNRDTVDFTNTQCLIGAFEGSTHYFDGKISNLRVSDTCRYTASFTPPTSPLTSDSNTMLLTCRSSVFEDVSSKKHQVNNAGHGATISTSSPFTATNGTQYTTGITTNGTAGSSGAYVEYTPSDTTPDLYYYCTNHSGMGGKIQNGKVYVAEYEDAGSANFASGTNSYLQYDDTREFDMNEEMSVDFWHYHDHYVNWGVIMTQATGDRLQIGITNSDTLDLRWNGAQIGTPFVTNRGKWHHYCLTRDHDDRIRQFHNGVLKQTSGAINTNLDTSYLRFGCQPTEASRFMGYVSDIRVSNGAIPKEFITPTTTTGTKAFVPNRVPRAISRSVGEASTYFTGSANNYALTNASTDLVFTNSQFSIEFWLYRVSEQSFDIAMQVGTGSWGLIVGYSRSVIYWSSSGSSWDVLSGWSMYGNVNHKIGEWEHICLTRDSSGQFRSIIDGVLRATTNVGTTDGISQATNQLIFASGQSYSQNHSAHCYISNARVCIGSIPTDYQTSSTTVDTGIFAPPSTALTTTSQGASDVKFLGLQDIDEIKDATGIGIVNYGDGRATSNHPLSYGRNSFKFGTSHYIEIATHSDFRIGSDDFSLGMWIWNPHNSTERNIYTSGVSGYCEVIISTTTLRATTNTNGWQIESSYSATLPVDEWAWFEVHRTSGVFDVLINGINVLSATLSGTLFAPSPSGQASRIGARAGQNNFDGWMSNIIYAKGGNTTRGIPQTPVQNNSYTKLNISGPTRQDLSGQNHVVSFANVTVYGNSPYGALDTRDVKLLTANSNKQMKSFGVVDESDYNAFTYMSPTVRSSAQSSINPYKGLGHYSTKFAGVDDYYQVAHDSYDNDLGSWTEDWTLEFFFKIGDLKADAMDWCGKSPGGGNQAKWILGMNMSTGFGYEANILHLYNWTASGHTWNRTTVNWVSGKWYHIAVVYQYSNNQTTVYLDGSQVIQTTGNTFASNTGSLTVGTDSESFKDFSGLISNFRISKGIQRYTSGFDVPTSPLTNDIYTIMLTSYGNMMKDYGIKNKTITASEAQVCSNSPFVATEDYDMYGSIFLSGTNSFLRFDPTVNHGVGSGDFQVELWWYPNNARQSFSSIFTMGQAGGYNGIINIAPSGTKGLTTALQDGYNAFITTGNNVYEYFAWNHVVFVRRGNSSNNCALYVNGIRQAQGSRNNNVGNLANVGKIGCQWWSDARAEGGFYTGVRFLSGTTTVNPNNLRIPVPTSPPEKIAGTRLLLNFRNPAVRDETQLQTITTANFITTSTVHKKFGDGALYFDGGNAAVFEESYAPIIGVGAFTIECFVKIENGSSNPSIIRCTNGNMVIQYYGGEWEVGNEPTPIIQTSYTIDADVFYHVALTRDTSKNLRFFVNGTQVGSTATNYTTNIDGNGWYLGNLNTTGGTSRSLLGYIDSLRITTAARYTSNFDAPTSKLPTKG